jgi:hypothetical protein
MPLVSLEPPHSTEAALEPEKPPVDSYRPSHGITQVKTVLQECRDSLIKPGSPEEQAALDKAKAVREAMAQKRKIQAERAAREQAIQGSDPAALEQVVVDPPAALEPPPV